ncbi:MAG: hypothetical protein P1V97_24455 [Planctomycetota bacterium]|nr:hypothetical protein [Planctomycetota bacterium]
MQKIKVHKVASSTNGLIQTREVETREGGPTRPGDVIVARALEEKRIYDQLELDTGRRAHISKGDIIVGTLGSRHALRGFVGHCPKSVHFGTELNVLNLGGVIGIATSMNEDYGKPLRVKTLGLVVQDGEVLNISKGAVPPAEKLEARVPLIVVSGTCMAAGKTRAACEIIARINQRGFKVGALKLSGVAALRDTLNMADHGAIVSKSFLDAGHNSTAGFTDLAPMAKGLINEICTNEEVEAIVIEMGDGIIGGYGVGSFYQDDQIREAITIHVMCATDLVAAWGAVEVSKTLGRSIDVMSGPATDNTVGETYVTDTLNIPVANARTRGERLADLVALRCFGRESKL